MHPDTPATGTGTWEHRDVLFNATIQHYLKINPSCAAVNKSSRVKNLSRSRYLLSFQHLNVMISLQDDDFNYELHFFYQVLTHPEPCISLAFAINKEIRNKYSQSFCV